MMERNVSLIYFNNGKTGRKFRIDGCFPQLKNFFPGEFGILPQFIHNPGRRYKEDERPESLLFPSQPLHSLHL
jgi:hypothetical protein